MIIQSINQSINPFDNFNHIFGGMDMPCDTRIIPGVTDGERELRRTMPSVLHSSV